MSRVPAEDEAQLSAVLLRLRATSLGDPHCGYPYIIPIYMVQDRLRTGRRRICRNAWDRSALLCRVVLFWKGCVVALDLVCDLFETTLLGVRVGFGCTEQPCNSC